MHSRFIIRQVVAAALAFFAASALGIVVADSAAQRAWTVSEKARTSPLGSVARQTEFRLSDHQGLRKVFLLTK